MLLLYIIYSVIYIQIEVTIVCHRNIKYIVLSVLYLLLSIDFHLQMTTYCLGTIPFTETPYSSHHVICDIQNTMPHTCVPQRNEQIKKKAVKKVTPVVAYLTIEEYSVVPKYVIYQSQSRHI